MSIKFRKKSSAIFREYLISRFLVNFKNFLDFASIKFRDFSQIAKRGKLNTRENKVVVKFWL